MNLTALSDLCNTLLKKYLVHVNTQRILFVIITRLSLKYVCFDLFRVLTKTTKAACLWQPS